MQTGVPFIIRAEFLRMKRAIENFRNRKNFARKKTINKEEFKYILAQSKSPLERVKGVIERKLQEGKEKNVSIVIGLINGTVIETRQTFSYHILVGRPSRQRGFKPGLELREGTTVSGVGGGSCLISNLLYLLAVKSGMIIIERHRHGYDLFPDHNRMIPFGFGATVFYNYFDLRFKNPIPEPILICLDLVGTQVAGKIMTISDPGFRIEIEEKDHRFFTENGIRMRENKIYRIIKDYKGNLIRRELLAYNKGKVMY